MRLFCVQSVNRNETEASIHVAFFLTEDYDPKEDNFSQRTFCHVLNYHSTFRSLSLDLESTLVEPFTKTAKKCYYFIIALTQYERGCEIYQCHCGGFKATFKIHWWKSWHLNVERKREADMETNKVTSKTSKHKWNKFKYWIIYVHNGKDGSEKKLKVESFS